VYLAFGYRRNSLTTNRKIPLLFRDRPRGA